MDKLFCKLAKNTHKIKEMIDNENYEQANNLLSEREFILKELIKVSIVTVDSNVINKINELIVNESEIIDMLVLNKEQVNTELLKLTKATSALKVYGQNR